MDGFVFKRPQTEGVLDVLDQSFAGGLGSFENVCGELEYIFNNSVDLETVADARLLFHALARCGLGSLSR